MNKRFYLSTAVKRGFEVGLNNVQTLIPVTLLFFTTIFTVSFAALFSLMNVGPVKTLIESLKGATQATVYQAVSEFLINHPGMLVNGGLALLLIWTVSCWLGVGFFKVMFDVNDTGASSVSRLFSGSFKTAMKVFAVFILLMVAIVLGLLLFIIPGIYLVVRSVFVLYFIIDKDAGIVESFKLSWHATQGQFWNVAGLAIVIATVSGFVSLSPLALLLASPLSGIIGIAFYRQLTEDNAVEQKQLQDATE